MPNEDAPTSATLKVNYIIVEEDPQSHDTANIGTGRGKLLDLTIIVIVVSLIALVESGYLPQRHLGFVCGDPTLSYPYRGDTISTTALMAISYSFPLIYIGVMEYVRGKRGRSLGRYVLKWYRDFLIGINIALVLCQLSKVLTGELRPHFLDTCAPNVANTCTPGEYIIEYECTSKFARRIVKDSFRSFPSGHTAVSTYAAAFTAYYVHYRYNLRQWGGWVQPMLMSFTLLWVPFASFSRLTDNRHHWWDVLAGFCIGLFAAVYAVQTLCKKFLESHEKRKTIPTLSAPLCDKN